MANSNPKTAENYTKAVLKKRVPTKKDRDEITVAKSIFDEIVEFTEHEETPKEARGRKGGKARAAKLTDAERSAIAKKAAASRWSKSD